MNKHSSDAFPEARDYFDGLAAGQLRLTHCLACKTSFFYPRIACPSCHSEDLEQVDATGRGTVFTRTRQERAATPDFDAPMELAVVELDEGPRLLVRMTSECEIGSPVSMNIEETKARGIPVFDHRRDRGA